MTSDVPDTRNALPAAPRRRSWLPWLAAVVVLFSALVLVGVLATSDSDPIVGDRSFRGGQMMGPAMGSDRDQMADTCQRWMSSGERTSDSTADASAWCGQMVGPMTRHMGDWEDRDG